MSFSVSSSATLFLEWCFLYKCKYHLPCKISRGHLYFCSFSENNLNGRYILLHLPFSRLHCILGLVTINTQLRVDYLSSILLLLDDYLVQEFLSLVTISTVISILMILFSFRWWYSLHLDLKTLALCLM